MFKESKDELKEKSFWEVMDLLDWTYEGDDNKVIAPIIKYLSEQSDAYIFNFHENMASYLYDIDGKAWAKSYKKGAGVYSDDGFLYCRCVAIVNGEEYYNSVKNSPSELNGALEFESILYVPQIAWAKKHNETEENYPYLTKVSFESGSNRSIW